MNNVSKLGIFLKSTITNNPTGRSGAKLLPAIEKSFLSIETSAKNHGTDNIFVSFEWYYTN